MYYIKMIFTPLEKVTITKNNVEDEDISGRVWGYLGSLCRNGQIYKGDTLIYTEHVLQAFFEMPELDSLDEKNCNRYVIEALADIKKRFVVTFEVLGRNTEVNEICSCKDSSWYVLYTHRQHSASPIVCGDCLAAIPVYKFSDIELPKDLQPELGWQAEYNLIDELWYLSSFDRFTYGQMSNPKSQLSRSGREICAAYENAIGKPFYYFLFLCHSDSRKTRKLCPICDGDWALKEDIGKLSFKCDRCRLVSI